MAKTTNKKLIELAKRYKEIQAQEAQLKKEKDEIKNILMAEMKERGLEQLLLDAYKILYSKYETTKFDTQSFKEEHSKMYNRYTYTSVQEKVLVNLGK